MNLFQQVIETIDANVISCLVPIILTLALVERLFKERFETKKSLNLIRWIIILYTIINWSFLFVKVIQYPEAYDLTNTMNRFYKLPFWIMLLFHLVLPFTLLIKKLASKFWYVLLVAFGIKIGMYVERFVIIITSYHRDYLPEKVNPKLLNVLLLDIGVIFLQGIIIALTILGIFELMKSKTATNSG